MRDPVCGMEVPEDAPLQAEHGGRVVRFCSPRCREKFVAEPERWLSSRDEAPPAPAPGRRWTCPMHPEIVRDAPGDCPLCGMALEPMEPAPDDEAGATSCVDMTRRFWVSAALSLPLVAIVMAEMVPALSPARLVPARALAWLQLALATPVVLWGGWPVLRARLGLAAHAPQHVHADRARHRRAYAYSVVADLAPDLFPLRSAAPRQRGRSTSRRRR
jgi:P-type Cu+ transporter